MKVSTMTRLIGDHMNKLMQIIGSDDIIISRHHHIYLCHYFLRIEQERNDQQRNKAKQDVEELLGKGEKKKKKKGTNLGDLNGPSKILPVGPLGGLASLERKPLPGINMQGMHGQALLPKSWTESSGNVRDSISVISVRDSEDFKESSDKDLFRTESSLGSPDRDVSLLEIVAE
jgi:hypothetical protein